MKKWENFLEVFIISSILFQNEYDIIVLEKLFLVLFYFLNKSNLFAIDYKNEQKTLEPLKEFRMFF